jgi:ribosomal protein S18 acetylase RimI-like enzyme
LWRRVLGFLDTCHVDDVAIAKPRYADVVGVLDIAAVDGLATIETIAARPDHRSRGIATGLLDQALPRPHRLRVIEI